MFSNNGVDISLHLLKYNFASQTTIHNINFVLFRIQISCMVLYVLGATTVTAAIKRSLFTAVFVCISESCHVNIFISVLFTVADC